MQSRTFRAKLLVQSVLVVTVVKILPLASSDCLQQANFDVTLLPLLSSSMHIVCREIKDVENEKPQTGDLYFDLALQYLNRAIANVGISVMNVMRFHAMSG